MRVAPWTLVVLLAAILPGFAAEHNARLPKPQNARYGPGQARLRGLTITEAPDANPEDHFAASALAGCLTERAVSPVPISKNAGATPALRLVRTGSGEQVPVPDEQPGPESREAYTIKITPQGGEIRARSSAGLFYGVETACQLAEGTGEAAALPEVEIQDWPSLAYRGVMVDMSHGPLPTEYEVRRQLDFLSRWKLNQYFFYNEASIELKGYPLLNPRGRFAQEQIRRLVAYGRERHIDVVPCLELYGHLHDLFRVEKYSELGALPHGGEFNPRNPKVAALLADWADQISNLFPSRFVHIGFDETWQISKAAKLQGEGTTPAQLFIGQLKTVSELFSKHGKRVIAWGDMIVKLPDILPELPPGLIAAAWEYDPHPDPEYKRWLEPLAARHVPHFIATGVNSWEEISPDFELAFDNIDTFLAAGRKSKALGMMNTVWTDDAQLLMRASYPAMAYGAAAAWQASPVDRKTFFSDYARLAFRAEAAPDVAAALEALDKAERRLQNVLGQATMMDMWEDPFAPDVLKRSAEHREDLRQTRLEAEEAEERLDAALASRGDRTTLESLLVGARLLDYAGQKFTFAVEIADLWRDLGPHPKGDELWNAFDAEVVYPDHGRIADLMDGITELRELYRAEWLAEYAPYRLGTALGRFDAEYESWRRLQARFQSFARTHHEAEPLPPLESIIGHD